MTRPERLQTLEELEGKKWGPPSYPSHLVQTCHALRSKPIGTFTVEDLRIMIGQKMGLPHLIPVALDMLEQDPLAEGDYFPGDLLQNVVLATEFLQQHPTLKARALEVTRRALADARLRLPEVRRALDTFVQSG